jgi:hypothetical protein
MKNLWQDLDRQIQTWWDTELHTAREEDLADPKSNEIWSPTEEHRERKSLKSSLPPFCICLFPISRPVVGRRRFQRWSAGIPTLSTGKLWEKYSVIEGNLNLPMERYPAVPLHGWSFTSIVHLGRKLFE